MAFKIKINEESILNAQRGFEDTIKKVLNSRPMFDEIGRTIIDDVRAQTRAGRSIPKGGRLKPLTKETIAQRKRIAAATPTHGAFSPGFSNLTLTGQLLDSMKNLFKKRGLMEIVFDGDHQPYSVKTRAGVKQIGKKIPNEKLADYVRKGGRPFFGVRKQIKTRINLIVRAYLRRAGKLAGFL